jgi:ribonucleoside-diphosphate reductase alpha chain
MSKGKEIRLTDNSLTVLRRRYLAKDKLGRVIETPQELFRRVAKFIAEAERDYGGGDDQVAALAEQFYSQMAALEFLPNSPTLMNAGRPLGQLSACFVLPVGDSMEEIFDANKQAALIHKSGGGTGFAFSRLRPRNSVVASTHGVASGPVSFMRVFNASTEAVKQGGTRRGANMGVLRVDHPDILEFIACKDKLDEFTNFNISVGITDAFMKALEKRADYQLIDPRSQQPYLVEGREATLSAPQVFDMIVERAWRTGEPGLVFLDRMNQQNPTYPHEMIEATNPCGEQPLPAYDSCNLGSINLERFVRSPLPKDFTRHEPEHGIDWDRLGQAVRLSVHFLDNVIEQNRYPIESIAEQTRNNRRIGLGLMGWADMLVRLGLPYNSDAAIDLGGKLMAFVENEGHKQSSELAKTRGRFPNWEKSRYFREGVAMRNATVTTIAPTGTLSLIAGCSSGIEPYYAVAFERNVLDGTLLVQTNPLFEQVAREREFYSEEMIQRVARARSLAEIEGIPDDVKAVFLTAADVAPEDHVRMQAAFQESCDSSVSKTINFLESATMADVRRAYELAYQLGCKGITVYRDNSRPDQVLSSQATKPTEASAAGAVKTRPATLPGITEKIKTGYGNLYVTVNSHEGKPFEVFAQIGRSGYTTMADTEAICRLISLALRSGVPVEQVIRQLRGIGGSSQVFAGGARVTSIPDAIAQVLERHFGSEDHGDAVGPSHAEICPECSSAMAFSSGCFYCPACGYSSC